MSAGSKGNPAAAAGGRPVENDGPLRIGSRFYRAHGLGNDYLVFEAEDDGGTSGWSALPDAIERVCHRHEGLGSDGIVVLLERTPTDGIFPLRMFNPDGSEFERSGNGLRVLAAYLAREELVEEGVPFRVRSGGSEIEMTVHDRAIRGAYDVSVDMGRARVGLDAVEGVASHLDERGNVPHPSHGPVPFVPVSVGNPHTVVFPGSPTEELLADLGPFLAAHPAFPRGTNVQLVRVLGPDRIRILIWERGVGRTSASGTSSCASAVASVASGRIEPGRVAVEMDGGELDVALTPELDVTLRGPVAEVAEGRIASGFGATLQG